jgi:hypothetical protein
MCGIDFVGHTFCRRFGELYSALQLASEGAQETFRGTACWFLLHQLLLTGDVERCYMLLTAHLQNPVPNLSMEDACEHFVLESLARCLISMPRYSPQTYSSMEQFQTQRSEWMTSLEHFEDSLPVRPTQTRSSS